MSKRIVWYCVILIAVISLGLIVSGFVNALNFTVGPRKSQNISVAMNDSSSSSSADASSSGSSSEANKNSKTVNILIIGDSIGKGTGDEKSLGIGGNLKSLLQNSTPKEINIENVAENGYKIDDLMKQFKSGNLDKPIKASELIVISIGGNDLRQIQALKDIEKEQSFRDKQDSYLVEFEDIVQRIRNLNKETQIIMLGLYNPYVVDNTTDNVRYVDTWSYNTQLILAKDYRAVFVPTYDIFKNNLDRFIATDKLHPNTAGYQTISFLISKSVESTLGKK